MKQWFQSLKPQDRRWAVAVGMLAFLLINYFMIWPHLNDWAIDDARRQKALQQTAVYRKELAHKTEYERKVKDLQSDGSTVLPEDQAIDFVHFLNSRAVDNKVRITSQGNITTATNDSFFVEQRMGIIAEADETNLVNFLYSLGAGNSMMRVRAMSLRPDQSRTMLNAGITIVASYQKKVPVKAGTSTTPAPAPVQTKPAAAPTPVVNRSPVKPPVVQAPTAHTNHFVNPFARGSSTNRASAFNPSHP